MKAVFEENIGKVAVVQVPHADPLKGTVRIPHSEYVVLRVGETDHFVAYQHMIWVFFEGGAPLPLSGTLGEEQPSVV